MSEITADVHVKSRNEGLIFARIYIYIYRYKNIAQGLNGYILTENGYITEKKNDIFVI